MFTTNIKILKLYLTYQSNLNIVIFTTNTDAKY